MKLSMTLYNVVFSINLEFIFISTTSKSHIQSQNGTNRNIGEKHEEINKQNINKIKNKQNFNCFRLFIEENLRFSHALLSACARFFY